MLELIGVCSRSIEKEEKSRALARADTARAVSQRHAISGSAHESETMAVSNAEISWHRLKMHIVDASEADCLRSHLVYEGVDAVTPLLLDCAVAHLC